MVADEQKPNQKKERISHGHAFNDCVRFFVFLISCFVYYLYKRPHTSCAVSLWRFGVARVLCCLVHIIFIKSCFSSLKRPGNDRSYARVDAFIIIIIWYHFAVAAWRRGVRARSTARTCSRLVFVKTRSSLLTTGFEH